MKITKNYVNSRSGQIYFIGINNDGYYDLFSFSPKEPESDGQTLSDLVIKGNTTLTKEKIKKHICELIDNAEIILKEED